MTECQTVIGTVNFKINKAAYCDSQTQSCPAWCFLVLRTPSALVMPPLLLRMTLPCPVWHPFTLCDILCAEDTLAIADSWFTSVELPVFSGILSQPDKWPAVFSTNRNSQAWELVKGQPGCRLWAVFAVLHPDLSPVLFILLSQQDPRFCCLAFMLYVQTSFSCPLCYPCSLQPLPSVCLSAPCQSSDF